MTLQLTPNAGETVQSSPSVRDRETRRFGMDGIVFNPSFFPLDWSSPTRIESGLFPSLKIQANKSNYENATDDERQSQEMGRGRGRQVRTGTRTKNPGQCGGISGDEPFGVEWRGQRFNLTAGISAIIDGAHSILGWAATSNRLATQQTTLACWTLSVKRLRTHRWRMRLKWVVF